MSTCIEKIKCDDCGGSDCVQTYLNIDDALGMEWYSSFCHGECWSEKGDPYGAKKAPEVHVKSQAEIEAEVKVVQSCKLFVPKKPYRGIPGPSFRSWGIRVLLSEFNGQTPYALGFPVSNNGSLSGWKCRPLKKKDFYGIGKTHDIDPFGFERAMAMKPKAMWFTEGEFDAIALDYCMTLVGDKKMYPVVSLTHGGGSITKNLEKIRGRLTDAQIKYLLFCLDDDEVGHQAEVEAKKLWPDAIIISKPKGQKDANDALKSGLAEEMGRLALYPKR